MLTKIFLTLLVLVGAIMVMRNRQATVAQQSRQGAAQAAQAREDKVLTRILIIAFVVTMLVIGGGVFYWQWQASHEVLEIKVINGSTGQVTTYQAYQDALKGRSFKTLDGRSITVGDSERIEVMPTD